MRRKLRQFKSIIPFNGNDIDRGGIFFFFFIAAAKVTAAYYL